MQKQTPPDPVGVLVDFLVMITAAVVALGWIRGWFGGGGLLADLRSKARRKSKPREPFTSLAEVERSIRQEGLESCSLILAVDFTRSNEFTGEVSFGGHSLHDTSRPDTPNPYQRVISIIGRTLAHFDDDGIIPAFGFGAPPRAPRADPSRQKPLPEHNPAPSTASLRRARSIRSWRCAAGDIQTRASRCFPFFPDRDCLGLDEVLERYSEIAAGVQMSGPTNFAPAIREAVRRVRETDNAFHVLIIVADGQERLYIAPQLYTAPSPAAARPPRNLTATPRAAGRPGRRDRCGDRRGSGGAPPPPFPSRTNWTRLVPPSVLTGHISDRGSGGAPPYPPLASRRRFPRLLSTDTHPGVHGRVWVLTTDAPYPQVPLAIVCVGVGDGPWDLMHEFDDGPPPQINNTRRR
jgi:hypothetical protein